MPGSHTPFTSPLHKDSWPPNTPSAMSHPSPLNPSSSTTPRINKRPAPDDRMIKIERNGSVEMDGKKKRVSLSCAQCRLMLLITSRNDEVIAIYADQSTRCKAKAKGMFATDVRSLFNLGNDLFTPCSAIASFLVNIVSSF